MGYYSCDFCFLKVTEYLRIYKKEPGALFLFVKIPTNNTYDYCEVKNILERGWWMIFLVKCHIVFVKMKNLFYVVCEKEGKNYGKYYHYYYISDGFAY